MGELEAGTVHNQEHLVPIWNDSESWASMLQFPLLF